MKKEDLYFTFESDKKVHVDVWGEGEPILCYSGFACSNYNFKPLAGILATKYKMIMIDARGMGKSDPVENKYSLQDLAEDGMKVMRELGHEKYVVLGISMGGFIAQLHTLKNPNSVKALGLLCTKGAGKEFPVAAEITREGFSAFYNLDKVVGNRLAIEKFVHPSFITDHKEELEKLIELRFKENNFELEQALMQLDAAWDFVNSNLYLEEIKVPTLVLAGEEDSFLPQENAKILARRIFNSELKFIKQTGHLAFFEKPKECADAIEKLIGRAQ